MSRRHDEHEHYYEELKIDTWVESVGRRLSDGDSEAIEEALAFLERDPYFFRSGYARERVARQLAHADLTLSQRARARELVVSTADGARHCPLPGVGRLAGAVADNSLRRALRSRLHSDDASVARRALRIVVHVRRPGLTADDVEAARALVLADAERGLWLSPTVARLARYLWSREWEAELTALLPHHGPQRAAAKRLVEAADRRRRKRPAP
jgi:hypothetical protein